jgi:hypothetical protein
MESSAIVSLFLSHLVDRVDDHCNTDAMSPSRLPLTSPVPIHRLRRILLRRPRQQDRQRRLFAGGAQDDSRSDTLIVFAGFTAVYFNEPLSWTQAAGFALIALGAALVFHGQA